MQRLVDLSIQRSQMSAERSYMNAERTLSVWLRTALAVMVVGIAIDRFRLFLLQDRTMHTGRDPASEWVGAGLVAFGVIMVVVLAVRYQLYAVAYCRTYKVPRYHGPFVASAFAVIIAAFGIALVILLLVDS